MVIPFNADASKNFSLKADTGENKTIFNIGFLDAHESAFLDREFTKLEVKANNGEYLPDVKIDISGKQLETVRLKLKGWSNFGDARCEFIEKQYTFGKRKVLSDSSLNAVKPYIPELANEIMAISVMSGEQEKN